MIDLFMPFRDFLKFGNISTDNNIFRMHYKFTVIMLLVFTLLVTTKQFFGEPIHCTSGSYDEKTSEVINSYCWIYGTYTLKSRYAGRPGKTNIYPGVGNHNINNNNDIADDDSIRHTYYQWVCFILLGQAIMFYTPRYLWKIWEGGRVKALVADFGSPLVSPDWTEARCSELVAYLSYTNMYSHTMYAFQYAFCEMLNLINVIGQIFLLDLFLGGAFRNYGAAVAAFAHRYDVAANPSSYYDANPMDKYFPKMTKCYFRNFGPTGTVQEFDRLCILPLNIVNEKIFAVLWFWLLFLAFFSALAVLFRIFVYAFAPLRALLLRGQLRFVKGKVVKKIVYRFGVGDWFVLYLLGKNMNPRVFKELVLELSKELDNKNGPV